MSVIKPGKDAHRVLAMADNRTYGLELGAGQTVQPQPFTPVGDGAGSIFKIFTTAAALEMGMGINAQLDVPQTFEAAGLGDSNTRGVPPRTWCVKNAGGGGRAPMNVTDALAQSPNTAFAKLIQQVGVPRAVDMAVRLGLRSYAEPGSARDYDPEQQGEPRRLRQAAEPRLLHTRPARTQRARVVQRRRDSGVGRNVVSAEPDRQGARPPVAAKSRSRKPGASRWFPRALPTRSPTHWARTTPAARPPARPARWAGTCRCRARPAPPSPIGRRRSSGFTNQYAAANYIFDDTPAPSELCSWPLRRCSSGNLYGGNEPARTWYKAMNPIADELGPVSMPPTDPRYVDGAPANPLPSVTGMSFDAARKRCRKPVFGSSTNRPRSTAISHGDLWSVPARRTKPLPAGQSRSTRVTGSPPRRCTRTTHPVRASKHPRRHRRRHRRRLPTPM